jgi:Caspase domain
MTRRALLVGNSVTYSDLSKSISRPILERTIQRLKGLLSELGDGYAFDVSVCIDERGPTVVRKLEELAQRAARDGDLLLFYYFGHGDLSSDSRLLLLHRGPKNGEHDKIPLEQLETRVSENEVKKSLFLLDCCYAGGFERTFPHTLKGEHCRIAATAPSSKAYVRSGTVEDPIGAFTSALMESFTAAEACVSAVDNHVSTDSLFTYVQTVLTESGRTQVQTPKIQGTLREPLFEYRAAPALHQGYAEWADEKTAYAKVIVICRALAETSFPNMLALHRYLTKTYARSFETLHKQPDGTFTYVPVGHKVVGRYLGFMHRVGLLDDNTLRLSPRGRSLAANWENRGNGLLLEALDTYLRDRGMTRDQLINATRRVLQNRRIPTKHEVADMLSLTGYRLPKWDVGLILDLLAYAGALRIAEQRAYFPW